MMNFTLIGDRLPAHFFLALDDELHVDRQLAAMALHQRLDGLDLHPQLALVVDCAAGVDVLVALGRLERRRDPLVQRLRRLDVIMRVAQDRGLAGRVQPVGVDQRMALGRNDLHVLHADAAQTIGDKIRRAADVVFVLGRGAHAGDAKQVLQFTQKSLLVLLRVGHRR